MLKNITLSADEDLIRRAREKARHEKRTLNSEFRNWLECYVNADRKLFDFDELMNSFSYAQPGKRFSREEMNERELETPI